MKPAEFISKLDETRITNAIAVAEMATSGEIRVFVAHGPVSDALAAARNQFARLGMTATQERNGVLIYIAPRSRQFAVWGDTGVHSKCGDEFWKEIVIAATNHLREGRFTEAVIEAVQQTGKILARHFPRRSDDRNELPDAVASS